MKITERNTEKERKEIERVKEKLRLQDEANNLLLINGFNKAGNKYYYKQAQKKLTVQQQKKQNTIKHMIANGRTGITQSEGEKKTAEALFELGLAFIPEHTFKGLFNPKTGMVLYVDFFVPQHNLVIEFDGQQHFRNSDKEELRNVQYRDQVKNNFCRMRDIDILRIKYYEAGRIKHLIEAKIKSIYSFTEQMKRR